MSSRIAVIAIDAVETRPVADFWCAVLGWRVVEEDSGGVSIAASDGSWPSIDVCAVPEGKAVKNRLHLDLRADGVTTAEELERLLALGAQRVDVGQNPNVSWVVLSDPEGTSSACSLALCRMPNPRRNLPCRSGIGCWRAPVCRRMFRPGVRQAGYLASSSRDRSRRRRPRGSTGRPGRHLAPRP